MQCEICGAEGARYTVYIEGAELVVCRRCKGNLPSIKHKKKKKPKREEAIEDIVENYGKKIKEARESLGLSIKELANKIAEKEHYLDKVEKEELLPDEKLIKKLEHALGIKLLEKVVLSSLSSDKKTELTLEDIVEIEKKD